MRYQTCPFFDLYTKRNPIPPSNTPSMSISMATALGATSTTWSPWMYGECYRFFVILFYDLIMAMLVLINDREFSTNKIPVPWTFHYRAGMSMPMSSMGSIVVIICNTSFHISVFSSSVILFSFSPFLMILKITDVVVISLNAYARTKQTI